MRQRLGLVLELYFASNDYSVYVSTSLRDFSQSQTIGLTIVCVSTQYQSKGLPSDTDQAWFQSIHCIKRLICTRQYRSKGLHSDAYYRPGQIEPNFVSVHNASLKDFSLTQIIQAWFQNYTLRRTTNLYTIPAEGTSIRLIQGLVLEVYIVSNDLAVHSTSLKDFHQTQTGPGFRSMHCIKRLICTLHSDAYYRPGQIELYIVSVHNTKGLHSDADQAWLDRNLLCINTQSGADDRPGQIEQHFVSICTQYQCKGQ